jgi:hypothetical protein
MAMREPEASCETSACRGVCGAVEIVGAGPEILKRGWGRGSSRRVLHIGVPRADDEQVNLTQCPYDGARIEVEVAAGGSLLLTCVACTAVWERHGAWTGRVREPDREKLLAARRAGPVAVTADPLPMVHVDVAD